MTSSITRKIWTVLGLTLIFIFMSGIILARAAGDVEYVYYSASDPMTPVIGTRKSGNYTVVVSGMNTLNTGWYVVEGSPILTGVTIDGDINLILSNDCALQVSYMTVPAGSTLNIYGQPAEVGKSAGMITALSATDYSDTGPDIYSTSMGGKYQTAYNQDPEVKTNCGNINIYGGYVLALGCKGSAAIGGAYNCSGGTVKIYGGTVHAIGGDPESTGFVPGVGAGENGGNHGTLYVSAAMITYGGNTLSEPDDVISNPSSNRFKYMLFKERARVTKIPTVKDLIYTGAALELVSAGEAFNGTMYYALGTNGTDVPASGWTEAVPKATAAGTYYIWYKAKGGSGYEDSVPKVLTVIVGEVTIRYNPNGGTGTMADQTACKGVPRALNANVYTREDYSFAGWNTGADGSGVSYEDKATVTLSSDVTLYAQWKPVNQHNHTPQKVEAVEPSCETEGNLVYYKCADESCDQWFEDETMTVPITDKSSFILKATGHKWDEGVVTKEPTLFEEGIMTYTCLNDPSHTREEIIPRKERPEDPDDDYTDSSDQGSGAADDSSTFSIPDNYQSYSAVSVSDTGGYWGNREDDWSYTKSNGSYARSEWMSLDYNGLIYWYYFGDDGIMKTDWFDYNNETYYLVTVKDGWRGRMVTGWKQIEDKWYYFEPTPGAAQGRLYRSTVTPDGHTVGADGAWDGVGITPVGPE